MKSLADLLPIAVEVFFGEYSKAARVQSCSLAARAASGEHGLDYNIWKILLADGGPESQFERTEIFIRLITGISYGFKGWLSSQDSSLLAAAPAQELLLLDDLCEIRDWRKQWLASGGRFYGSRMVALKTDLVWHKLSAFGLPWPPFEVGSEAYLENVLYPEALRIGLLKGRLTVNQEACAFDPELFKKGLTSSLERWEASRALLSGPN